MKQSLKFLSLNILKGNKVMKKVIVCCLLFVVSSLVIAQQSKEEKLQQLKSRSNIKVTEIEKDILKLEYPNGKVLYKNVSDYRSSITDDLDYSPTYDSTVIDLTTIDTTLYYKIYIFWQEVPVAPAPMPMSIKAADINQNYLPELYGFEKHYQTSWFNLPLKIFELDPADSIFRVAYTYTDTITRAEGMYDINGDGQLQLFTSSNDLLAPRLKVIYKKPSPNSFAITEDFHFTVWNQMNDPMLGDYDNNGLTDLLYYSFDRYTAIFEYNPAFNRFDSVYAFPEPDVFGTGFSAKDIDGDGYPDIVLGTINGFVHVLEYQPGTGYQNTWNDTLDTYNAYVHFTTIDIDGNGKPEFWVGGDAFYGSIPKTLYTCYESVGNNNYKIVAKIWIEGVFSFDAYNAFAVDVDKDGVEEIGLCVDQHFLILKFTGSPNQHSYELYYIKKNEIAANYNVYYGASMYDLTGDAKEEILISRQQEKNGQLRLFTSIYRPSAIVPVELISFTASTSGNNLLISWSTASELNNKGFEVQRSEVRGQKSEVSNWERIAFVEGHGTTSEQQNYSYKDSSLTNGKYFYRLKQIDYDGSFKYSLEIEIDLSNPLRYSLEQNYPNPFNSTTTIEFSLAEQAGVTLKIYNILGKEVKTLIKERLSPGNYLINWDAKESDGKLLPTGIYLIRLSAISSGGSDSYCKTIKTLLLK
jgi:hypothetical protein